MTYYELIRVARDQRLQVIEKPLKSHAKGLCKGRTIIISSDIKSEEEKNCILIEEIAHAIFSTGNILDMSDPDAREQEYRARSYAYEILVPLHKIEESLRAGCATAHEAAQYLGVTDEFLHGAFAHYSNKYGKKIV